MKTDLFLLKKRVQIYFVAITLGFFTASCLPGQGSDTENAKVTTIIDDFPANDALSVDRSGKIYGSNFGNFGSSGGTGTTLVQVQPRQNDFVVLVDNLIGPLGNAVDRAGNIYVNNANNFQSADVLKIAKNGSQEVLATIGGFPSGMAIDNDNNLYISNFITPTVHKVTPGGEVVLIANDARLAGGVGIDFDDMGNLLVANYLNGEIFSVSLDGDVEFIASIPTVVENFVIGYITFYGGFIYATAIGENLIYKASLEGDVSVFAGNGEPVTIDGPLLDASFNAPNGITVDPIRRVLYISEFGGSGSLRAIKLF